MGLRCNKINDYDTYVSEERKFRKIRNAERYGGVRFLGYLPGRGTRVIRLKPGESVEYSIGGETDEGWRSRCVIFSHMGDHVQTINATDGEDCDGRLSTYGEYACPLTELRDYDGLYPAWERVDAHQRDYRAEQAGY